MSDYPPQVEAFHIALRRFVAVIDVDNGFKSLEQLGPDTYSLLWHRLLRGSVASALWHRLLGGGV